mgnify:CR=1 FL=1
MYVVSVLPMLGENYKALRLPTYLADEFCIT